MGHVGILGSSGINTAHINTVYARIQLPRPCATAPKAHSACFERITHGVSHDCNGPRSDKNQSVEAYLEHNNPCFNRHCLTVWNVLYYIIGHFNVHAVIVEKLLLR